MCFLWSDLQPSRFISSGIDTPFPSIPLDVVGLIFQLCADEDKDDAITLMQVSKWAHKFVKPVLYRNPIVSKKQAEFFIDTISTTDFGRYVRRLYIPSVTEAIIKGCPNLQVLFSKDLTPGRMESLASESWPSPQYIVCQAQERKTIPNSIHPLFRQVTHLVVNSADLPTISNLPPEALPSLRYLAVNYTVPFGDKDKEYIPIISKVLKSLPQLQIMVLVEHYYREWSNNDGSGWKSIAGIEDSRLIARPGFYEWDYEDIMNEGVNKNIWDYAERDFGKWRDPKSEVMVGETRDGEEK